MDISPVLKRKYECATFALLLSVLALGARASSEPTPPCAASGSTSHPGYSALDTQPNVGAWHDVTLNFAASCPAALNGSAKLVIALASRFVHAGTVEDLAARIGAVSKMGHLKYWSVTDGAWRVLISKAFAVDDGNARRPRSDFSAEEVLSGQTLVMAQRDTRSTGLNLYALMDRSHTSKEMRVTVINLTDIRFLLATIFRRNTLISTHFFTRLRGTEWGYYSLTVVKDGSVKGREKSFINRAAAFQRFITGERPEQEPALAR